MRVSDMFSVLEVSNSRSLHKKQPRGCKVIYTPSFFALQRTELIAPDLIQEIARKRCIYERNMI